MQQTPDDGSVYFMLQKTSITDMTSSDIPPLDSRAAWREQSSQSPGSLPELSLQQAPDGGAVYFMLQITDMTTSEIPPWLPEPPGESSPVRG
ncbi:hypothetical protein ACOMHN_045267 [Nucella lapillus]